MLILRYLDQQIDFFLQDRNVRLLSLKKRFFSLHDVRKKIFHYIILKKKNITATFFFLSHSVNNLFTFYDVQEYNIVLSTFFDRKKEKKNSLELPLHAITSTFLIQ